MNPEFNYPGEPRAVPPVIKSGGNRRAIRWIVALVGILIALFLGLLVLLLIGADIIGQGGSAGPIALLFGLIAATIPVPFYILLVLWIDRYEAEPLWLLAFAFLWGATIAAFTSFLINSIGGALVTHVFDAATGSAFGAVISAPIVEESSKGLALFILFFWKKDEFDGIVDGIVYASMVALGFAMTENIKYYAQAALGGGASLTGIVIVRGMLSPFAHPLFTSMTGIGLGWARQTNNRIVKFVMPVVGLGLAMALHATWNLSAVLSSSSPLIFLGVYVLFMVPVFVAALVVIYFGLRREGRVVSEHLACDLQSGALTHDEYVRLCTIRGRMGLSLNALTQSGVSAWRRRMRMNQLASELAFHRSRAARGFYNNPSEAQAREFEYLMALRELRRQHG